ncbi:MAG: YhdP family protein [Xanthomonadales bacterium]
MTTLKLILRRTKTLLWTVFSIIAILAAVVVGTGQLLMPYSARYQTQLEGWLSREFGQPVAVDSFEGEWAAFGPRLQLRGLRLLPAGGTGGEAVEPEAVIASAALDIRPLNALVPGRALYNFRVIGAQFELVRDEHGEYRLSGLGISRRGANATPLSELARVGEVVLEDSSLDYRDAAHGVRLGVTDIDGVLRMDDDRLSAQVSAQLYDRRSDLRHGDVEATLELALDSELRMLSARWQAGAERLMLAALQGRVPGNPFMPLTGWLECELWGEWSRETGHRVGGVTDLRDALFSNDYQDMRLERVNYRFQWRFRSPTDWNLHVADFFFDDGVDSWTTPRVSMARDTRRDLGLWISADRLPLGVPLQLTRDVMSVYENPWPGWLPDSIDGGVRELDLVLGADWRLRLLQADVSDAQVAGSSDMPAVRGLDARIDIDTAGGEIRLNGDDVTLDWPRMFRDTLTFTVPACTVELSRADAEQAMLRGCRFENEDLAVAGDMVIVANGGRPALDLNAIVSRGRIDRLDAYWPEGVMPENTVAWLRRGLLGGELENGRAVLSGDLDDWPFRAGSGRFEAVASLRDLEVDYSTGWPVARDARATVRFLGPGLWVDGMADDVNGVPVRDIRVAIPDMGRPELEVSWRADSDLPGLLEFLDNSPLRDQADTDLSAFEFAGSAATAGELRGPLGSTAGTWRLDGAVTLRDARFTDPQRGITLDAIAGEVTYSETGFRGTGLAARFQGRPATLNLLADRREAERFRAEVSGAFDVATLLATVPGGAGLLGERVHGTSRWRAALVVAPRDPLGPQDVMLHVDSDLGGIAMELPAPLEKPAVERWPFRLALPIAAPGRPLDIVFEDRVAMRLDLDGPGTTPQRGLVRVDGRLEPLPPVGVMRVAGIAGRLDLDGWVDTLTAAAATADSGLAGLQLETDGLGADQLIFLDRLFPDVGLDLEVAAPDFRIGFSGADIDGDVRYRRNPGGTDNLAAEFERLVLGEPRSAGLSMRTDPADLPAVHLYARSFRYGGLELGETRIEAFPSPEGFEFEKIDANSPGLSVQARGVWSLTDAGPRSDFRIHMVSESLGDFLQAMEISSSVQGGQTVVDFDAWWTGAPAEFALSRLNGQLDFSVVQGNITNASAGPGRLLGLVSVQALPKRLALDFRDVFDSGFSFDEATGSFTLQNGVAETNDTRLKSSSATIDISGRTDLDARRYDQLITIRPGVGNTLPIIGALAAGPGGAAAGLALQGLLHEQLGQATQVRYSITGSWDEPTIEPVEIERAEGG